MKQLTCEVCGGNDLLKQDGVFVCQSCGCKYSADEVKKLMVQISEPVKVEGIQNGDDLFENINSFIKIGDYKNATSTILKMKSLYPTNYKSWIGNITLATQQMSIGNDVDDIECIYQADIIQDKERAVALCPNDIDIIMIYFENYKNLLNKKKAEQTKKKKEILSSFARGDCNLIHNFYCAVSAPYNEDASENIYIFKFQNNQLYLDKYNYYNSCSTHKGTHYVNRFNVHIREDGMIVNKNNKPIKIRDYRREYELKISKIEFAKNMINTIVISSGLRFKKAEHNDESLRYTYNFLDFLNDDVPKGGCYIATSVYGSYDCPQVWTLRRYRDYNLAKTWYGRAFIKIYYAISPTLVKWFGNTTWFQNFWKNKLDKMVCNLKNKGYEDKPY